MEKLYSSNVLSIAPLNMGNDTRKRIRWHKPTTINPFKRIGKCFKCGTLIVGTGHTTCAMCEKLFCAECMKKSMDRCPNCGYEG